MPTFYLSEDNDTFQGTHSNDSIHAYHGNNIVWAHGGNDRVYGGNDLDWLFGGSGDDRLYGRLGDDWLAGDSGNDYIDGGGGNDRMEGGTGDDFYLVHDKNDLVLENAGEGTDKVQVYLNRDFVSYSLADNVENLRALGGFDRWHFNAFGNDLDNHIQLISRSTNQVLFTARGKDGDDTIVGSRISDWIYGGDDNDTLLGNVGDDKLYGEDGDDILRGGVGNDLLVGYNIWYESTDDIDILEGGPGSDIFELARAHNNIIPYAQGTGYAIIQDFNENEDIISLGSKSGFSLREGNFDDDRSRDDTAIYYGSSKVGVIVDTLGLSLNASYFV
ncbi:MAG: hypothetical protein AAF579_06360 [Cyanobacteria bacterium P01_C01_bin.118]